MKRTTFALKWPTHIGGRLVEAGVVVATVESEFPCDSIFSLASQLGLVEVDENAATVEQPQEEQVTEAEAGSGPDAGLVDAPPVEEEQSETTGGTSLESAGMSEALYSRLAKNNITTVEQLTEFVAGGGDLVALDDIGVTYAKRIQGWLTNHSAN